MPSLRCAKAVTVSVTTDALVRRSQVYDEAFHRPISPEIVGTREGWRQTGLEAARKIDADLLRRMRVRDTKECQETITCCR